MISEQFLQRILLPNILRKDQKNPVLFLDQATCHTARMTREEFARNNVGLQFIPKRMTGLLQPPDVSWFSSMKRQYQRLWTDWLVSGEHGVTKNGNLIGPGYERVNLKFFFKIFIQFIYIYFAFL